MNQTERINALINHPSIFPHVSCGMPFPLDIADVLAQEGVVAYDGAVGAVIFEPVVDDGPGVYEGHYFFLPEGRGKVAIRFGQQALRCMFERHNARLIWGYTPWDNVAARAFNRLVGLKSFGKSMKRLLPWGPMVPVEVVYIERD